MTEGTLHTPAPGSDEARKIGCTCAVIDNHYGRGYRGRSGVYVVNEDCRVHGSRAACKLCGLVDGGCVCDWLSGKERRA